MVYYGQDILKLQSDLLRIQISNLENHACTQITRNTMEQVHATLVEKTLAP